MIGPILRKAASIAAAALVAELQKPENQAKLGAAAQQAAAKLRDPETAKKAEAVALTGARALGRAVGKLKNR